MARRRGCGQHHQATEPAGSRGRQREVTAVGRTGQSVGVQEATLTRPGRGIALVGIFVASAALWVWALPLAAVGLACGLYAKARGERLARIVIGLALVCGLAGFFI